MQDADGAFNSSVPFAILLWSFQQQEQQRRNYERIRFLSVLVAWAASMVYTEIQGAVSSTRSTWPYSACFSANGQNLLERLGQRAKNAVENKLGEKVEQGVNDVLDGKIGKKKKIVVEQKMIIKLI